MKFICNDQLTRVRVPYWCENAIIPRTYQIGGTGEKNGMRYTIHAFGSRIESMPGVPEMSPEAPRLVWMFVKFKGIRGWVPLLIGDTNSFHDKLVFGIHNNAVFNR
jgi:hypothetical protein